MSAGRICVHEVDLAKPDESVQVAAARMHSRKVGTLVVLDGERRPIGIVTDRDLAVKVLAEGRDPFATNVRDVMSGGLRTVEEETAIEEALSVMREGPFRRLPVVDEEGRLAGLLSLDDILDLLREEFDQIGDLLKREGPGSLSDGG